jgi:hypothetical protein
MWKKSSTESDEPNREVPYTDSELPNLLRLLIESELPISSESSTLTSDPHRTNPYMLAELPRRAKLLKLIELPRWRTSRTDKEELSRDIP